MNSHINGDFFLSCHRSTHNNTKALANAYKWEEKKSWEQSCLLFVSIKHAANEIVCRLLFRISGEKPGGFCKYYVVCDE